MTDLNQEIELIDWEKGVDGLVPAIVQDAKTGVVLMMAWLNREAARQTVTTGKVTFFSRSRQSLWVKGETSGNYLDLVSIRVDCDKDTVLIRANPQGPACHTGATTCFGAPQPSEFSFLSTLQSVIVQRGTEHEKSSYTASLLNGPLHRTAQKVGEEAVETILAATSRETDDLVDEAADLLFHLMVLLSSQGSNLSAVVERLSERHRSRTANDT